MITRVTVKIAEKPEIEWGWELRGGGAVVFGTPQGPFAESAATDSFRINPGLARAANDLFPVAPVLDETRDRTIHLSTDGAAFLKAICAFLSSGGGSYTWVEPNADWENEA